uniref:Uncharacterized protein n=1 Tax=viral metagenome TaxID=1070528 RepID=A0A6C0J061_9ZZZZ
MNLKDKIYTLYDDSIKLSLEEYNNLIKRCVDLYEMDAVVFLYDRMKNQGLIPDKYTYKLIDKLHSKTCKQSNTIYIKNQNINKLPARRRIHKIMKGYNYSDNYNRALIHLSKVKLFLNKDKDWYNYPRIKLAKYISNNCKISFNDSRYIITNLKKTNYFKNHNLNLNNHSKMCNLNTNIPKTIKKVYNQNKITDYFK